MDTHQSNSQERSHAAAGASPADLSPTARQIYYLRHAADVLAYGSQILAQVVHELTHPKASEPADPLTAEAEKPEANSLAHQGHLFEGSRLPSQPTNEAAPSDSLTADERRSTQKESVGPRNTLKTREKETHDGIF